MPSPAGHSLIGLAIGMLRFVPCVPNWRSFLRVLWHQRAALIFCIVLANIPDLDYLFGIPAANLNLYHHTVTHTAIWVLILALGVWACGWPDRSWKALLFVLCLVGSHLLADIFTQDRSKPYGIMLCWPFWIHYWYSPVSIFPASAKRSLYELFSVHNVKVVMCEILITFPLVLAVASLKIRKYRRRKDNKAGEQNSAARFQAEGKG